MAMVDSCCGCFSLRVGAMMIAIFFILHCYVFLIQYARCINCATDEVHMERRKSVRLAQSACWMGVIGKSIGIVSGILLFIGSAGEYYFLIFQWFGVVLLLVLQTLATNFMIPTNLDRDRDFIKCWLLMFDCRPWVPNCKSIKVDVIYFVGVGVADVLIFIFCMVMVFSYIKDLRDYYKEQRKAAKAAEKRARELEEGEVEDEGEEEVEDEGEGEAEGKDAKEEGQDKEEDETSRMEVGDA